MEVGTINAAEASTGSRTMADLIALAGRKHADRPAIKHKVGDEWVDIPYKDMAEKVKHVSLGLVDLGIQPGDKVSILSNTRPEWTYACFGILGAGATCVSIYQTNSPEECHYVLHHSESRAVFVEDAEQLEKVREVEAELPKLELIVVIEPSGDIGDAIALDGLCGRGRRRPDSDYEERLAGVGDDDVCLYIYTSGTTGPPKGCVLTHGNYRRVSDMVESDGVLSEDEVIYLFLPLAHACALLIQFGGRIRQAVTGAAPISKEILEFFYACGVPVMEGYGMTETSTVASSNRPDAFRFGSVGKPLTGVEARIADDGELLLRGPNIFKGYFKNEAATDEALADGWLHTGDLGSIDGDGFIYITGRKKDIIITAGGKNITPANLENSLKQNRWISQAVVVGDRRPYLVVLITLDPEEIGTLAEQHGLAVEDVPESAEMRAEVEAAVKEANSHVGRVEQIEKFKILPHDLSQQTGELTPTLKVKRNVVNEKFAGEIEALYAG